MMISVQFFSFVFLHCRPGRRICIKIVGSRREVEKKKKKKIRSSIGPVFWGRNNGEGQTISDY